MDPGTILASVAATLTAVNKAVEYLASVKNAPAEKACIVKEVKDLRYLLVALEDRLRDANPEDPWYQSLRSLAIGNGALEDLNNLLGTLSGKPGSSTHARDMVWGRLKWHFDKGTYKEILRQVGQAKLNLILAVDSDQFTLNLAIHGNVAEVREEVSDISTNLKTSKEQIESHFNNARSEAFLTWIDAPRTERNYEHARSQHHGSTGRWLLERQDFETWLIEAGKLLWISGIPGAGKSILASTVIDHLQKRHEDTGLFPILYFYFDYKVPWQQTYNSMLKSLIVQCCGDMNHLPGCVLQHHESYAKTSSPPSQFILEQILSELLRCLEKIYIVLDALDESRDQREVIKWAQRHSNADGLYAHHLIFSRQEAAIERDLGRCLWNHISLNDSEEKVNADIDDLITFELEEDDDLSKWSASEKSMMRTTLIDNAHGMFQWVRCQLDALKGCLSSEELEETLEDLPETLDGTYERILRKIPSKHTSKAAAILRWLCVAKRPLGLTEIADLLAVDLATSKYIIKRRLRDPRGVLQICGCLITTFPRSSSEKDAVLGDELVQFSHRSVQEYLVGNRIRLSSCSSFYNDPILAHHMMAETCIVYLHQFDEFEYIDRPPQWTVEWSKAKPALNYCAYAWGFHLSRKDLHDLDTQTCRLFKSEAIFRTMCSICPMHDVLGRKIRSLPPKLHYAAYNRAYNVCQSLIREGFNVDYCDKSAGTALQVATCHGHEDIVRLLLDCNANPDIASNSKRRPWETSPLVTASRRLVNSSISHMLLDAGARQYIKLAFARAPAFRDLSLLEKYFQRGVKADDCSEHGVSTSSALNHAICTGREDMVRLLIDKGADVNRNSRDFDWATDFMTSLGHCNPCIARVCFEAGGDISPLLCHVSSCGWMFEQSRPFPLSEGDDDYAKDKDVIATLSIMMEALKDDLDSQIILWKLLNELAEGKRKRNSDWLLHWSRRSRYNLCDERMLQEHIWNNFQELVKFQSDPGATVQALMKKWDKLEDNEHNCHLGDECISLRREEAASTTKWAREKKLPPLEFDSTASSPISSPETDPVATELVTTH